MNKCRNSDYIRALMLYSAQKANILPLTSVCNVSCIFCSNRQNPPGVEVYNIAPAQLDDIEECLQFMDDSRPVVIGESVTRICEGEPFTNPRIKDILRLVRRFLPGAPIQITTNGSLLDQDMVSFLSRLNNVIVYLSLNSCSDEIRGAMMRDKLAGQAVRCAGLLQRAKVEFHGSIVAVPHLYGYQDLEAAIRFLAREGARTVRVFIPGYTRLAPDELCFPVDMPGKVRRLVSRLQAEVGVPLMCEPPELADLKPEVAGVISGSPASKAGILAGDVIKEINGYRPYSRVDAFSRLRRSNNPKVLVDHKGTIFHCLLDKEKGQSPGVVMEYDLGPEWEYLGNMARHRRARKVLVVTSDLAREVVEQGMCIGDYDFDWSVIAAPNRFFGGSIRAAGLLVVDDMVAAVQDYLSNRLGWVPDLVLLPPAAFDHRGRDLTGCPYRQVGEKIGLPVEII